MPFDKKIKTKPEIYQIYYRQRMGADSKTEPLTQEYSTSATFSSEKSAVEWILQQTDHGKIYIYNP